MRRRSRLTAFFRGRTFLILALTVAVIVITYFVAPRAFNIANGKAILLNISYLGVVAIGVACLLMCGGIDFGTSAHATFGMVCFSLMLMRWPHIPWGVIALITIGIGLFAGAINAFLTQVLKLMPFIATIGMTSVWSGLSAWIMFGNVSSINRPSFTRLATTFIGNTPIPVFLLLTIFLLIVYGFMLKWTRFGRSIAMVGGNPAAARLAGLNPAKVRTVMFLNNGFLGSIAGLMFASQLRMGTPTGFIGMAPEMSALTGSILGGVSFAGGSGGLVGAFFGVLLINLLSYSLQAMGTNLWLLTIINGLLLVTALTIDGFRNRKLTKGDTMGMPGMSR